MLILHKRRKDTVIVSIDGELDHHTAEQVRNKLEDIMEDESIKNIIYDLKNLRFMDSSGIGVFIGRYKLIVQRGGRAAIINANLHIAKVMEVSGLGKIIRLCDNEEEAMDYIWR